MTTEEWRPVVGHEGAYEVSDLGRVRSLSRLITVGNHLQRHTGRVVGLRLNRDGYPTVVLAMNGKRDFARVPVLVCEAWHGPRPEGLEVRHLDGTRLNASPENLAWGTHAENCQDTVRHGTHSRASRTHCTRGHEYTPENTSTPRGYRECLACRQIRRTARAAGHDVMPKVES